MKIHEIIEQDGMFKRYADKYSNPLAKYSNPELLPERYFKAFIKQANIDEIALFYLGYQSRKYSEMVSIIAFLYRHHDFEIPLIEGILTEKYWFDYACKNYEAIQDQWRKFN